jgi:hypothetical protein
MICPGCGDASGFMLPAAPAVEAIPEPAEPAPIVLPAVPLLPELMPVPPGAVVPAAPSLMPDPPAVPPVMPAPPAVPPGCMAGDPEVVDPEPVAVGRSADGSVVFCARAGAATRAEARRHAVICVLSIDLSLRVGNAPAASEALFVRETWGMSEQPRWAPRPCVEVCPTNKLSSGSFRHRSGVFAPLCRTAGPCRGTGFHAHRFYTDAVSCRCITAVEETMKLDHAVSCALAGLGLSLLVTSDALADQSWQGYAPRCQPAELARDAASRDPCETPVATFGLAGPTVLSRSDSLDVQSTGSIDRDERGSRSDARSPL